MIGKRIQELRIQKGWSISELAVRARIAKSYLSTIERDIQSNPSVNVLEKLSYVLEVSINELLETQAPPPPSLDSDWLKLVEEAMNSGVSKEQFREFLEFNKWRNTKQI
ncbi:DNA-binding anti-repressor SinI [Desulfosporosinus sp. OT]|uniref:helix-turn-helix domain-containing protein n=1 Tax=Desulfosporosinus sp. OT TaxID=913865 RepID=UPI000223A48E|nr:DNA-binding anti-repressor SinI [Desulfosporosinus sp. OT]EGW37835.1 HTH-type transcriptional regulator sinR [Desulfosporosinus sp. OT]